MKLSEHDIIKKYNALNGKEITRTALVKLERQAFDIIPESEVAGTIHTKLSSAIDQMNGHASAVMNVKPIKIKPAPKKKAPVKAKKKAAKPNPTTKKKVKKEDFSGLLHGLECIQDDAHLSPETLSGTDTIYDFITRKIIDKIKKGGLMWRKPWNENNINGVFATNYVTKSVYSGINFLLLNALVDRKNIYWLTFNQIEKLKGTIKEGAKSSEVVYYKLLYKDKETNKEITITEIRSRKLKINVDYYVIPLIRYYRVFNADDVAGVKFKYPPVKASNFEDISSAKKIIDGMPLAPPLFHKGNQAFYRPGSDTVTMPNKEMFDGAPQYYSTLFHEMVHSTGHKSRVGRSMAGRFGDKNYAFEELIAELGASFLCGEAGILYFTLDNTAAYIKSWQGKLITAMENDNRFVFRASSEAQQAANFMLATGDYKHLAKPEKKQEPDKPASKAKDREPVRKTKDKKDLDKTSSKSKVFAPTLSGFTRADQATAKLENTFELKGEMGEFLGTQQRHKLVIALTGDYHGGKSEFAKQLIDAFADNDFTIGLFDLEQGGLESKDTRDSLDRNVKPGNRQKIAVTGEAEKGLQTVKEYADKFDVIVIDSGQKLGLTTNDWLDQLRNEFPETIFVVIFQQNAEGGVRGGAAADFDAPVALKAHRVDWTTYKNNYVSIKKNRGNRTDLRYMIADKKTAEEVDTIKESEE